MLDTLAAALALPIVTTSGQPLPERPILIAVTFIVIVMTLLIQGLSMPMVIRRAHLEEDPAEPKELMLASIVPLQSALVSLDDVSNRIGLRSETQSSTRADYETRLHELLSASDAGSTDSSPVEHSATGSNPRALPSQETQLQLALIPVKRAALLQLRSDHKIDDAVLRAEETTIDIEEIRLAGFAQEQGRRRVRRDFWRLDESSGSRLSLPVGEP